MKIIFFKFSEILIFHILFLTKCTHLCICMCACLDMYIYMLVCVCVCVWDRQKERNIYRRNLERKGFPSGSDSKESACNEGDLGSIHGWGRSPGEGHGNPLQYSCLKNSMDRGAWWATVYRAAKNPTRLSN